ncbi:MAG: hypothetical protein HY669_02335 [Chloroflexi bacterium]|nr:hypothetical protein [Chloroflexota bacterium]
MKKILLAVFVFMAVVVACRQAAPAPTFLPTPTATPTATLLPTATPTPTPAPTATPHPTPSVITGVGPTPTMTPTPLPPIRFSGSGDYITAAFFIPRGEWQINWAYEAASEKASFGFLVYPEGEAERYIESITALWPGAGTTAVYGWEGQFYIKVMASEVASWMLDVQRIGRFIAQALPVLLEGKDSRTSGPVSMANTGWDVSWSYEPASEGASFKLFVYRRSRPGVSVASFSPTQREGNTHIDPFLFAGETGAVTGYVKVEASRLKLWILTIRRAAT